VIAFDGLFPTELVIAEELSVIAFEGLFPTELVIQDHTQHHNLSFSISFDTVKLM
jgi:hypothetical protein